MIRIACYFNVFCFILLLLGACTDPTDLGADLLEGDEAEVGFTDTLTVRARTLRIDTVLTYLAVAPDNAFKQPFASYLIGNMQDPVFGTSKAELYAQLTPANVYSKLSANTRFDSVVLVLPYGSFYGDTTETYGISVYEMTQYVDPEPNYYSDIVFKSGATPLGTKQFIPNRDSVTIIKYPDATGKADTIKLQAQLRIPLSTSLGEKLLSIDTALYKGNDGFVRFFNGLHLKPTTTNKGMVSFNILGASSGQAVANAGIFVYFKENDTLRQKQFYFLSTFMRATAFEHNYKGSVVEKYIDNTTLGDSLVFVQGMAGVITELEIPFAEKLQGLVVNKAELELRLANPPGNNEDVFKPVPFLRVSTPGSSGAYEDVDDLKLYILQSQLGNIYGGTPTTVTAGEPQVYKINLSTHLQNVINGKTSNKLRIKTFTPQQEPYRVALYGTRHPQYGIKLKVAFTRPPG
jgi:hypothetical protein